MRFMRVAAAAAAAAILSLTLFQTTFAAHSVLLEGSGSVNYTYGADFDTGVFNTPGLNSIDDFYYEIVTQKIRLIQPKGGGQFARMGSKPSYAACVAAPVSAANHYNARNNVGRWFCVLTNDGRYARMRIDSAAKGVPMAITYRTWCKAGDPC